MLPIPAPIIGSTSASVNHRKLFLPLIYLGATASLCYLFLFAFIVSNETSRRGRNKDLFDRKYLTVEESKSETDNYPSDPIELKRNLSFVSDHSQSVKYTNATTTQLSIGIKRKRSEESEQLALSSTTSSSTLFNTTFKRKTLSSLRRKTDKPRIQHGTRRSNPTKIWSGHQDLDQQIFQKGYSFDDLKPSTEVYTYPWSKDQQCKTFRVQFAKTDTFKPRALVSFPGSGNSWLRYMIQCASGYFTGSVYNDKQLFTAGLLGEFRPPNDGSTIVQKTHHDTIYNLSSRHRKAYIKLSELMFGYRGLLLIRNPFDALVSYWNFINTKGHKMIAKRSQFDDIRWIKFVTEEIPRWTSLIMSWIENSQDFLIVFYEEVEKNPRGELIRILEYLDQRVDMGRLNCLTKPENLEGPFHRPHQQEKTSDISLSVDLIPVTTTSQQGKNIQVKHQKEKSFNRQYDHGKNDGKTLLLLDSKKSQHQQQHPQSPSSQEQKLEEQKEDKFLSSSPVPSPFHRISLFSQHDPNQYTNMTRSTLGNDDHHKSHQPQQYHNNHLNNSSILRLDLIIQDNIDKINRFFLQKGISAQLQYGPRPSTKPYFLHTVQ